MIEISVQDNKIEIFKDITRNILSILITQNGLLYSIYNKEENKYLLLKSKQFNSSNNYLFEIEKFVNDELLNETIFNTINIVISDYKQILVPDINFSNDDYKKLWELNFSPNNEIEILYSKLNLSSNVLIYPINKNLLKLINKLFKEYNLYSSAHTFISKHYTNNKLQEKPDKTKLFVQVFENYADILLLTDSNIKLFNSIKYHSDNDLCYHIINIFDKLRLAQDDTEIVLSGFIEPHNISILYLRKFIKLVYFESLNINYKYHYKFQDFHPHYFYNFLNLIER